MDKQEPEKLIQCKVLKAIKSMVNKGIILKELLGSYHELFNMFFQKKIDYVNKDKLLNF